MAHSLIRKGKGANVKKACALAEKTDKAIRRWCKQYGIGRSMPGSPIEISMPALDGETWRRGSAGAGPAGQLRTSSD
jgi:hypothetical protein